MRLDLKVAAALAASISGTALVATVPAGLAAAAPANVLTSVFAVDKMTCATCPIAVKTAMGRVAGVKQVKVDFKARTATVTYDPAIATPVVIASAATDIGFPAHPVAR
jgi:mercuric ion binding protein